MECSTSYKNNSTRRISRVPTTSHETAWDASGKDDQRKIEGEQSDIEDWERLFLRPRVSLEAEVASFLSRSFVLSTLSIHALLRKLFTRGPTGLS